MTERDDKDATFVRVTHLTEAVDQALQVAHARLGNAVPAHVLTMPADEPVGFVLAMHGGGWSLVGEATLPSMDDVAARWAERGWAVLNVDYRAGAASIDDAVASWDALRSAFGPGVPGVAHGKSAGGHLALMTAAARGSDVAGVVAESAPTDLAALGGFEGADNVRRLAATYFGSSADELAAASPASADVASRIEARLLLAASDADEVVPPDQVARMAAARPGPHTQAMVLDAGEREFIHAGVTDEAFDRFVAAESELADAVRLPRAPGQA